MTTKHQRVETFSMSTGIQTVEFQRPESLGAYLSSELDEGPPFTIHGVALGADDVTVGKSGIKKLWPAEELRSAADTLKGRNLVVDHDNGSTGVVGKVTKAGYKDDVGVIYEAELFDEELAEKISNSLLEVSIRGKHADVNELEEDDETEAKVVEDIMFANLSIVPSGAAPSNSVDIGEHEELSIAELSDYIDELQETAGFEAGDTVQWGDNRGIILQVPEDDADEVEVDIYEEQDDQWRSTGEAEMVAVDDLDEWDVSFDDIGPMESDSDEEEEAQEIPDRFIFESRDEAEAFIEDKDGLTGVHEMDDGWMPGDTHDEFVEWWDGESEEEMAALELVAGETLELIESFIEGDGGPDASISEFKEWADDANVDRAVERFDGSPDDSVADLEEWAEETLQEEEARMEGEEKPINSKADQKELVNQSPERFPDGKSPKYLDDEEASVDEGDSVEDSESDTEELQETEVHQPSFDGTTTSSWDKPALEDFGEDPDLSEVGDHFIVSVTGFPPENYGDLALPVVEPNGNLNLSALQNAKARAGQVDGLSGDNLDRAVSIINSLANEEFDADFEENEDGSSESQVNLGPVTVLTGDDLRKTEASKMGELSVIKVKNMTDNLDEQLAELDEPVAVEKSELEDLEGKADRFDEMADSLEALRERTEILDEVDREQIEELAESDDPVVLESERHDELTDEAEQVKNVYAAALADNVEVFDEDELTDRFSIEELREKYEEHIGDPAEELTSEEADPQSADPSEEELEGDGDGEGDGDELTDEEKEIEELQANLREKIIG